SGCEDVGEVERALLLETEALGSEGALGIVVAAEIRVDPALQGELAAGVDELRQAHDDATLGSRPWIHWARLRVASADLVDHRALRERQDLLGSILRRLDALLEDPAALEELLARADHPLR